MRKVQWGQVAGICRERLSIASRFWFLGAAIFADYATDLGSGDAVPGDPAGVRRKPGNGFGYGIGVRIQSPLGPIRVDYGLNDRGENRIHFGIGERF